MISEGLDLLLQPEPIFFLLLGVVIGFLVGVLPGLDSANAAALLLPFSILLSTETALILLASIYIGTQVAGSIPAILLNIPGTASSAVTAIDGHQMMLAGKGAVAIGVARMASAASGVLAGIVVLALIGPLSGLALLARSPEMFLIAAFGLMIIGTLSEGRPGRGILAGLMGMLIAAMSASPETGIPRFTFGQVELYESVPFVPALIGLFGVAQMLVLIRTKWTGPVHRPAPAQVSRVAPGTRWQNLRQGARRELGAAIEGSRLALSYPVTLVRSTFVGLVVGHIPGLGGSISNFISYDLAKRASKDPGKFGKGNPEGVAAAEGADNAAAAGSLVPTLSLGVPGSPTAAVMLAALYLHGVVPGPQVMQTHGAEVYAVLISVVVASALLLPLGVVLAGPLASVGRIPVTYLAPIVLVVCISGALGMRGSVFDVGLMLVFGVLGYVMRMTGFPVMPMVLGMVLGPIAESNLMRSLLLSQNDVGIFVESWFARGLILAMVSVMVFTAVRNRRRARELAAASEGPATGR